MNEIACELKKKYLDTWYTSSNAKPRREMFCVSQRRRIYKSEPHRDRYAGHDVLLDT